MKTNISFIMTVYNTPPKLLYRSIDSVIKKMDRSSELIIVDDGSEKIDTCTIISKFDDERIRFFKKINGGPSSARNVGINHAIGKYIMFIDSDDYLDEELLIDVNNDDYDIMFFNYRVVSETSVFPVVKPTIEVNTKNFLEGLLGNYNLFNGYAIGAVWAKLYKRSFLINNSILFDESITRSEDFLFNIDCVLKSPLIKYIDLVAYNYYVNDNSLVHSYNKNLLNQNKDFLIKLREKIQLLISKDKITNEKAFFLYNLACYHTLYFTLITNSFNPKIKIGYKERKNEAKKSFIFFNELFDLQSIPYNSFSSIKGKIKLFFIKRRFYILIYFYITKLKKY